ncbi:MAG: phosphotransferase family protein [Rhodospirillaceae bacterium]|nr:phosphotransferase family protein [Rhodospirillaceae bacterium]
MGAADDREDVIAALRRVPGLAAHDAAALRIAPLPGLTNRTFRIELAGEAYALRLPRPGSAAYIDRQAEAHNTRLAAELGLAPPVVFFDSADGVMLTRFVPGAEALTPQALRAPARLAAAAALLRRLHGSGRRFRGAMHLFSMLDRYLRLAGPAAPGASALARLRAMARPVEAALAVRPEPFVPCHVDPSPQNFLAAGDRLYLIDWEYAAMCEPLWDLAGLSNEAGLDAAADADLLRHHEDAPPTPRRHSRFMLLKAMLDLLAAAWAAVQAAQGNDSQDFAGDVAARLARVEAALAGPDLGRHLAAVGAG